ncbi:MAG: hypothetical protein Q8N87_03785 [bacterium]|nr:hypothetical protein [bacterium]
MSEEKQKSDKINPHTYAIGVGVNRDVLKRIIIGVAIFVVIVLIFGAGMFVGGMKARFSYRWAENYHENFGGPRGGFLGNWRNLPPFPGEFIESRGTFGEIIKVNDSDLVVKGQGNTEKVILITEKTAIEKGRETIKKDELKVGDSIVIIGSPNDKGQIEAKLIRLFDGKDIFPNKVK